MRRNRLKIAVGGTIAGAALGIASLAWACTAQLGFRVEPGGAVAGAAVAAKGDNATGPVEIRWNSVDGALLAKADVTSGGTYAAGFTVPDAAPGVYTVVALSHGNDGRVTKSESAFRVSPAPGSTGLSSQTVAADVWSGFGSASTDQAAAMADGTVAGSSGTDASQLRLGVGLLASGLAALGAGFAVAEARRRKAIAQSVASR